MSGYRVSVETDDPLAIDEALCRSMRWKQRAVIHTFVSVVTFGLWLPVLVGWLVTSGSRMRKFAEGYGVRISGGVLTVGTTTDARTVPLDAVAGVTISGGFLTIAITGTPGAQPFQVYGLRNPAAAARAILQAREDHLRSRTGEPHERAAVAVAAPAPAEAAPLEIDADAARVETGRVRR